MRKLGIRFTITFLCFSLGIAAARLATPHLFHLHREAETDGHQILSGQTDTDLFAEDKAGIADTVKRLREIKTEQFDARIPPPAKPLLTLLKRQLLGFIGDHLNSYVRIHPAPDVQRDVLAQLSDAGIKIQKWEDEAYSDNFFQKPYAYGDIYDITVAEPAGHPELRVVTTTLGICCGDDTSFYVFKNDDRTWRLVLAEESNDYDQVNGAQGMFQYAISPVDERKDFFIVTANVNPWCSSNWQSLRYQVMRLGTDPYHPRTILSDEDSIYLGGEPPYELHVKEKGFTLEFPGESTPEEVTRKHVVSYHISAVHVVQTSK
jgi:hypothetical protein